jgi:REP element-mobilizing transposase RayT
MPFHIDARVVLPEHMHALWTLPEGDADFPRADGRPSRWILEANRGREGAVGESAEQGRARNLAAPVLGAHDQE